jgi:hypothetical protein
MQQQVDAGEYGCASLLKYAREMLVLEASAAVSQIFLLTLVC